MEAVRQTSYGWDSNVMESPITNQGGLKGRPVDEFMDELAQRLGKHYGLNDIREVL